MSYCIRNVTIVDTQSKYHLKSADVWVKQGIIQQIGKAIKADDKTKEIDGKGLFLSPGWLDFYTNFCDPGEEHKETIETGLEAAAAGGYTAVMTLPNTDPVVGSKSAIEYILRKSSGDLVDVWPAAVVTINGEGKDLAEMLDMNSAGAVAFTDGEHSINDAGTLMRALQYAKAFNGLVINSPDDRSISKGGVMNEGITSTKLGLKSVPSIAEEVLVTRDIYLAQYTQSRLMIGPVSTARSVELIREAKKKGIEVHAFVLSAHLMLDDSTVESFDSNYKIMPPLRVKDDIKALKKGLKDGTIDIIASGHQPQNEELKKVEYDYAANGIINLQTSFAVANTALKESLSVEELVEKFAVNPRKLLGKEIAGIDEGKEADLTLFSLEKEWTFESKDNKSLSQNSPFFGIPLKGKAVAVFNNKQFKWC